MSVSKVYIRTINWIKSDIDRALLTALLFSLPFDRIPSVDIFGITIRLSLVVGVMVIIRFLYLVIIKRVKVNLQFQEKLILGFLVWLVLIIPEAINLKRAIEIVAFNGFTVVLAISVAHIFKKSYIKSLVVALLSSTILVIAFGVYQYVGDLFGVPMAWTGLRDRYIWSVFGFPRIQSTALEPLYLASFLLLPFSVLTTLFVVKKQSLLSNRLVGTMLFLVSLIIFMTVSRGGIYGLIAALIFIVVVMLWQKQTSIRRIVFTLLTVGFGFVSALIITNYLNKPPSEFTKGNEGAQAYVSQIQETGLGDGGDERAKSRQKAVGVLQENKLAIVMGIGPGQFGPYVQNNIKTDGHWTIVNNLTLELLVETGIVGLLLVVVFFLITVLKGLNIFRISNDSQVKLLSMSLCGFFVAQAIQYQTYSTLYIVHIWVAAGLLLGITTVVKIPQRSKK